MDECLLAGNTLFTNLSGIKSRVGQMKKKTNHLERDSRQPIVRHWQLTHHPKYYVKRNIAGTKDPSRKCSLMIDKGWKKWGYQNWWNTLHNRKRMYIDVFNNEQERSSWKYDGPWRNDRTLSGMPDVQWYPHANESQTNQDLCQFNKYCPLSWMSR